MGGAHEVAEQTEHQAHGSAGKDPKSIGKYIGLSMAVIGVLLALCSAMVGTERTELVKTMVEQSDKYSEYQAVSTKYRLMLAQAQQTYALTPSRQLTADALGRLDQLPVPKDGEATAARHKESFKELTGVLTPRKSEVEGLLGTVARYGDERTQIEAWAESYDDEVKAHLEAAEHFERAQLLAEVGIVLASIALLLSNRAVWGLSVVAGALCLGLLGKTWTTLNHELHEAEDKQRTAMVRYEELRGVKDPSSGKRRADVQDDEMLARARERFDLVAPTPAPAASASGAPHE